MSFKISNKDSIINIGNAYQNNMNDFYRRKMGAHYTSEKYILYVIKPLFLNKLYDEFNNIKASSVDTLDRLKELHNKIASLKFLDPACGCGNFLIITYCELRKLENEILKEIVSIDKTNNEVLQKVSINQFYGIEIEESSYNLARSLMLLIQETMNNETYNHLGIKSNKVTLEDFRSIVCDNALTINWEDVISPHECSYIIGNPPFAGTGTTNNDQKQWLKDLYPPKYRLGGVDFVTAWFIKASDYMLHNTNIKTAFVATNSICQGEQVPTLWNLLLDKGIIINFAYTSFKWTNDTENNANVTCVIVGFSYEDGDKYIYRIDDDTIKRVKNISPYLIDDSTNTIVKKTVKTLNFPLTIKVGNRPNDDGNLLLTYDEFMNEKGKNPGIERFIKKFKGSREIIHGKCRYCIWLNEEDMREWSKFDFINQRVEKCRKFREQSVKTGDAYKLKDVPWSFGQLTSITNPKSALAIPIVSSETRDYIPMDFVTDDTIISNSAFLIPNADLFIFSIVTSRIHMVWMRLTGGRMDTRYRYSKYYTYNTFILPHIDEESKHELVDNANKILEYRANSHKTLAELYDPNTMPIELKSLHSKNDMMVDMLYKKEGFNDDAERLMFLIQEYSSTINSNCVDVF